MRKLWRRILAFLCAAALWMPAAVRAEFSPLYEKMRSEGAEMEISVSLEASASLSGQSLAHVNEWLSGLKLRVTAGDIARAEAEWNGSALLSAAVKRENGYTLTSFASSGSAYLTDPGGPDALALLAGQENPTPDITALPDVYFAVAPKLYAALEAHVTPKTVKEPTSIKNASAAASYVNYLFKNGELNEAWEDVMNAALPALREALAQQPGVYAWAEEKLTGLTFSGECRFKRFLDKEGKELGLQFTGQAARGEDKWKVTLFGGYTKGKGGYVSLTLAGVGAKDTLKTSLGVKLTEQKGVRTLAAEGAYSETKGGQTVSYDLNANLKNAVKDAGEHWTGKITLTATEKKEKTVWTLTPDLTGEGEALTGTVKIQEKKGSKVTLKATATVGLRPYRDEEIAPALSAKDLRGLSQAQAQAAVLAEMTPLAESITEWITALPEADRTLLLHELRTDAWMNGPTVPAADWPWVEETGADSWVVEEDEQ